MRFNKIALASTNLTGAKPSNRITTLRQDYYVTKEIGCCIWIYFDYMFRLIMSCYDQL